MSNQIGIVESDMYLTYETNITSLKDNTEFNLKKKLFNLANISTCTVPTTLEGNHRMRLQLLQSDKW